MWCAFACSRRPQAELRDAVELQSARGVRGRDPSTKQVVLDSGTAVVVINAGGEAPVLSSTSGAAGTLLAVRSERRGENLLTWYALSEERLGPAVLQIRSRSFAVFIDRPLNRYAELAALPAPAEARAQSIDALLPKAQNLFRLALLMEKARLSQRTGSPEEAVAGWRAMAEEAAKLGEPSLASHGLRSAAYVAYFLRRDFAPGDRALEDAARIDERFQFLAGIAKNGLQAGLAAQERGRLREAETLLREAYRTAWEHGLDREAAFAMKALGPLLQDQGRHAEALAALEAAGPAFSSAAAEREQLWYQNDLAWVLLRGGREGAFALDPARIQTLEHKALALAAKLELKEEQAGILANLAALAQLTGERERARELSARARTLAPDERSFSSLFLTLLQASLALEDGQLDRADQLYGRAEESAIRETPGGTSDALWRAIHGRARVASARKEEDRAEQLYRDAMNALERSALAAGFERGRASYLGDRQELLDDARRALEAGGRMEAVFELSSQFRAHLYRVLELENARARLLPAQVIELERIERGYRELRSREETAARALSLAAKDERAKMEASLVALRQEARSLIDARLELLAGKPAPIEAKTIQRALAPDELLVDFSRDGAQVRAFLVTTEKIEQVLAAEASIAEAVRARIPKEFRHLTVIAGEVRAALQLAAPDLIQRSTVSYLPHPAAIFRTSVLSDRPPLIAGDPQENLPHARAEANELAARFPDATVLMGSAAKRISVLDALAGRRLFHFAGHGELAGAFDARLELAGGSLRISDVFAQRAQIGVVVLSGCEMGGVTQLGRAHAIALPESFFAAGAGAVLAATEKIADRDAKQFIFDFYDAGGDRTPVKAYAAAARKQIAAGLSTWRSFRVVGRP